MRLITDWFYRRFTDPQILALTILVVLGFAVVLFTGAILAPLFAALILAYLLEGPVVRLERFGMGRTLVVSLVFVLFLAGLLILILGVMPMLTRQVTQFVAQIPSYITKFQSILLALPERYPGIVTDLQVKNLLDQVGQELATMGQAVVTQTLSSISGVITIIVYLVLVPVLLFFLMKDKQKIIAWFMGFLPRDRHLASSVWEEVNVQLGNYVRGKTLEILIVGSVTFITFSLLGLQYALLLATLVGFSVLIPYIGAAVVTLPVAIVGFFQFGWSADFAYLILAYGIIQLLDGNALVPLLFSEVVDLHPVAIIVAVLLFGGIWGFWGVFFAIPLATLFNAIFRAVLLRDGKNAEEPEPDDDPGDMEDHEPAGSEAV